MKTNNLLGLFFILIVVLPELLLAQAVEKNTLILGVKYFNDNNISQHLVIEAKSKIDGKFQKIGNIPVKVFITNDSNKNNLIAAGMTSERGELLVLIPASAKGEWLKSNKQNFVALSAETKLYDEARAELAVTKAKIKIDTLDGKMVKASVMALLDTVWTPMAGVELVLAVKRLGGNLNINETLTYTTDTSGSMIGEFKRDSLPGDQKGNLVLIANVIDNDTYGNLSSETTAPWGTKLTYATNYNHRSLFARRGHSPFWLEFLAYGIILAVWAVIVYLIFQIREIKKLGAV